MVAISLSGSGEGPGWVTAPGYSTVAFSVPPLSTNMTISPRMGHPDPVQGRLAAPANRLAWQGYTGSVVFPQKGYYEIWARATDRHGRAQPMLVPGWNPKGYLNNACHRVAVRAV